MQKKLILLLVSIVVVIAIVGLLLVLTKPKEDPHAGETYNPYTDKWSFL